MSRPLFEHDEEIFAPKFKAFLASIGVSAECEALTYSEPGDSPEYPGLPGYIKFHGSGCSTDLGTPPTTDRDWQLADQFEAWLRTQRLSYFRGYPDAPDARYDRRFFLGYDACDKLKVLREAQGLRVEDLDCA